ncbi:hypothetical protein [Streptomyces zagrosensis]|uniref:Uncharacterized protein n=1 Tax=Streptomyces zagrosensis TaxID=1042984 RepID=A0A7W9UW35_9ACTN|nr:hypothetical protein [Streptomyces zagrosensis]MBB5933122.1 hypothetical protein [Streptomyces zagrosensis]
MLGSLLEGALVHAAEARQANLPFPKPLRAAGLQELVQHAHTKEGIDHDAKLASELFRTYRTLVHPLAEKRTKHRADFDTADLCWSQSTLFSMTWRQATHGCTCRSVHEHDQAPASSEEDVQDWRR